VGELVAPPRYLSASQRKRWRQIIAAAPPKLLRAWDETALASFIIAEEVVVETNLARQAEASRSLLEVNTHGTLSISPLLRLQAQYLPILRALGSELGFSPASRAGLKVPEGDDDSDGQAWRWKTIFEGNKRDQVERIRLWQEQQGREAEPEPNRVLRQVEGQGFVWVDEDEEVTNAEATATVQADTRPVADGSAAGVVEDPCGISPAPERDGEGLRQGLEEDEEPVAPGAS
jgi:P27 family predicted phage terminase small subunit